MKRKYILKGDIVQPGNFLGEVKIFNDPHDPEEFRGKDSFRGMILVIRYADKNILKFVAKAKGLITDLKKIAPEIKRICQEKNIPCIVGTKKATKILKDGVFVEISGLGRFGKINLLDHPTFKSYKKQCLTKVMFPKRGAG